MRVFFVISGYLITYLLLREAKSRGKISLRAFYIRRTFRIFPAFYTFLAIMTVLTVLSVLAVRAEDLAYAATYTINFVHRKSWEVGHLWSLAVEEQFYLLWPLCLVAFGISRATKVALGAVLLAPLLRVAAWYLLPEYRGIITKAFPTICDTIATGCLLACYRERLWNASWYRTLLESRAFLLVPTVALFSNAFASHTRPDLIVGQTIRNVGIALCIDWCLRNAASRPGRFLNCAPMVWIGGLSYSLYLWQQIFLNRNSNALACSFPINVFLAFAAATLSYYLIERPCLRARVRLSPNAEQEPRRIRGGAAANTPRGSIVAPPEGVAESTVGTAP